MPTVESTAQQAIGKTKFILETERKKKSRENSMLSCIFTLKFVDRVDEDDDVDKHIYS